MMIYTQDPAKIIEQVYSEAIIENIDIQDIRDLLSEFTLDSCKVVLIVSKLFKEDLGREAQLLGEN